MWDIVTGNAEAVTCLVMTSFFAFVIFTCFGPLHPPKAFSAASFYYSFKTVFGVLFAAAPLVFLVAVLATGALTDRMAEIGYLMFVSLVGTAFLFVALDTIVEGDGSPMHILFLLLGLALVFPLAAFLYQFLFETSRYQDFKALAQHAFNLILYPAINLTVGIVLGIIGVQFWRASARAGVFYYYPPAVLFWLISLFLFLLPGTVAFLNYLYTPETTGRVGQGVLLVQPHFSNALEILQRYGEGLALLGSVGIAIACLKSDLSVPRASNRLGLFFALGYLVFLGAVGQFLYSVYSDFDILLELWQ
jgi:hypothetical protein